MPGWERQGDVPDVAAQCTHSYSALLQGLGRHGLDAAQVVRLDHHTASQGWLAERQRIRADFFGRPCKLASTGVAVSHSTGLAVSTAMIASMGDKPRVMVSGAEYGMAAISTCVEAQGHLFVSGILKTSEDADANIRAAVTEIAEVVALSEYHEARPVRFDLYVARADMVAPADALLREQFGEQITVLPAVLPFAGDAMIEITSLFACAGVDGLHALPVRDGSLQDIAAHLRKTIASSADIARIDIRYPPGTAYDWRQIAALFDEMERPACIAFPGLGSGDHLATFAISGFLLKKG